jgi:hypothetical protein
MKNNLILLILATTFMTIAQTSCKKADESTVVNLFSEQSQQDIQNNQAAIIGSWQFTGKSIEVVLHNCIYRGLTTSNMAKYMIKWAMAMEDEKRDFKQNGEYNLFLNKQLACNGTFKIANNGVLDMNNSCKTTNETIVELTTSSLTIKKGETYFRYQKLD